MKRISSLVAGVTLLIAPLAVAQSISVPNLGQQATQRQEQPKTQKLVKVATISGAEAVHEFRRNVNILQSDLNAAKELQAQVDKESDKKKKQELQGKLEAAMKKLESDNAVMTKSYGFSLTRNYVEDAETISLYTVVTDEEAAKVEEAAKQQAKEQGKARK